MASFPQVPTPNPKPTGKKPDTTASGSSYFNRRTGGSLNNPGPAQTSITRRAVGWNTQRDTKAGHDAGVVKTGSNIKRR
jgi:hypothetical protein